ncbi:MAG: nitroreductase family protein [Patescibacteria group bacterium]
MVTDINIRDFRQPEQEINPLILKRWSPRALSGGTLSDEELMALFEAAKWAPSSSNSQPWRFIYAKNQTPHWDKLFSLLGEFNQAWTKRAAVLVLVLSRQKSEASGRFDQTASFSAGAAWENLALEATSRGLIAHGMSGFDYERAKTELAIRDDYKVEAMIAIGRPGNKEDLSDALQARETPSGRKPLRELVSEGEFKF